MPAWDTTLTAPPAPRDASSAAVTAYGLALLAGRPGTEVLVMAGRRVLAGLVDTCLVRDRGRSNAGAVLHGCYRFPEGTAVDNELIWSDFYVALALHLHGVRR